MNLRLNKLKKKNLIYSAGLCLLLLILASLIPYLRTPLLNTLKYPLDLFSLIKREIKGIIFYHRNFIQHENLKKEIDALKKKLNDANEIYLENVRLRELLAFKQRATYKIVAARVIGRSLDNWSSLIIIDKGSFQSIREGMTVITYAGLVGKVFKTTASTSQVMLINDPNFAVSSIAQRSRQDGLVSGTLGGFLMMRYLPQDCDIKTSDVIITSGLTENFPKGLIIGRVVDMGEEFSGLLRYAMIKPAVNLSSIEEVLIIIP